jgi:hypothetical protein
MIRNGLGSTVAALGMVLGTMAPHGQAWHWGGYAATRNTSGSAIDYE